MELDLHGIKHSEVDRLVENFVLLNETPMRIITGNSDRMINIVQFKLSDIQQEHLKEMIIDAPWGRTTEAFLLTIDTRLGSALEEVVPKAFDNSDATVDVDNVKKG